MKRLFFYILTVSAALSSVASAQSVSTLTVEVSAVTGVSTQGIKVDLNGEESGWVFDPVKVDASGLAKFSYVPDGVYTLTVDGSPLGLETFVDNNLLHQGDQTVKVELNEAVRTPYALKASVAHDAFTGINSAFISWNQETDYFFDDFESYEPFVTEFAPWTGHDLDREPAAEIQGYYPNRGLQQYATIFNALTIDPPVYYEYEVLRPYSGKQYVGFVRTRSGAANNDWLISPKIKVGVNNVVSFMAKGAEYTPDRFSVCISTTGTDVKDFVQLTPGNYQTVDYKSWQEITYSLAKYEGQEVYIAIHCMSQNSFMLMVDDFYVGPVSLPKKARRVSHYSAANPNEKFVVSLDGNKVGETEDYEFTLSNIAAGNHTVGVKALYLTTQSEESTVSVNVPGADSFAFLTVKLSSDIDASLEGIRVELLSMDNAELTVLVTDKEGTATVGFLPKGEYIVNIETDIFDLYNSSLGIDGDKELSILLKETILDPFNVLYQTSVNENGTADVEFSWNQDLGFRDSFEEYDDFMQRFGEWTVLDIDKMPTYAFSIGGTIIEWPTSRDPIGAMIFNPESTRPVKASDDGLFLAPDGKKYVMFSSAEMAASDDWLISPSVKIGNDYVLRFSAKSYDANYPGDFEFCALKDKNIASPRYLDSFRLTTDWTRYEIPLDEYVGEAIEIAFHHTTFDGWLSFVDDIYVGPGEESTGDSAATSRCNYDIFLDKVFHSNVSEPTITFKGVTEGTHIAGIQALYPSGKKSNVTEVEFTVDTSGVITIIDNSSETDCRYFDLNGLEVDSRSLSPGIYIRLSGNQTTKVIVK